jgi:type IV pilus assembly protein PilM
MANYITRYLNFVKKFIPTQPDSTFIGLDVGANECRLVELKRAGKNFEVTKCACEPIHGSNPLEAVKNAMLNVDTAHAQIHASVQGKGTLIRYIAMPRMSIEELRNSFSLESDKYFPFAQDKIYTDCHILDPQGKSKQMEVLAAASTKDLIDARIKLLNEAGVQADSITLNSIALANIVNTLEGRDNLQEPLVQAIVNIGDFVSSVTIMAGALPRFSRDIFIGGMDLRKRISNALGVSEEDAGELLSKPLDKEKEVTAACESIFQNITQEIRLSFDYFSTEKNKEVTRVLLAGEIANNPGIKKMLQENLEMDVEIWCPSEKIPCAEGTISEELKTNAQKYSVALGLALLKND